LSSGDKIKEDGRDKFGSHGEKEEEFIRVLVGRPVETKPVGTPRRRCEYYFKLDRKERGWQGMDWNNEIF
jgi:hypothetical protein